MAIEWPNLIHCGMYTMFHIRGIFSLSLALLYFLNEKVFVYFYYSMSKLNKSTASFFTTRSRHILLSFQFKRVLPPVLMKQKLNCSPEQQQQQQQWLRWWRWRWEMNERKKVFCCINRTIFRWTNDVNSRMGWSQKQANNKIKQKKKQINL